MNTEKRQMKNGKMTELEFKANFGLTPARAKELMIRLRQIVNREVEEVIKHADYYVNPTDYCTPEYLSEWVGYDALEKDEDDDGYPNLYEFGREHSVEETFKDFISIHTTHGGHTSAIQACDLMEMEIWNE